MHCQNIVDKICVQKEFFNNYLLTYDSYVPLYNRFHRGEWITRVNGGEGALDTPGPLNGTSEAFSGFFQKFPQAMDEVENFFLPTSKSLDP